GEAEGRVGADKHLVVALEKRAERADLSSIVRAGRVAEVPFRLNRPVRPKATLAQRLVIEARADRLLRHNDDCLFETLVGELVEGDEHQRAALARSRGRLNEKVLFA